MNKYEQGFYDEMQRRKGRQELPYTLKEKAELLITLILGVIVLIAIMAVTTN